MLDWKALGQELSSLHGGMSKAARLVEVDYQTFQRITQGKIAEPKFSVGLKILAALGAVSIDTKVLTVRKDVGTMVPTPTEETVHGPEEATQEPEDSH